MYKKSIKDIDVAGKKMLVRCDFNVPLDGETITDETRIIASLPTIKYLLENEAKVILCSHLGRPRGTFDVKYSLKPVAQRLSQLLNRPVAMASDVVGESAKKLVDAMQNGGVIMLENVRFHSEEEKNSPSFAKELAQLADIFVNDAFGTAHRAHASTAGVAEYLPAVCGFLIEKEINFMSEILTKPQRPFAVILGGAKVSDKISAISNLIDKLDTLIIGGGMAYTFLKAQGKEVGKSICEDDFVKLAYSFIEKAERLSKKLLLPQDVVVAKEFKADSESKIVSIDNIPPDWMGMDIGPLTVEQFSDEIKKAKSLIWNGPMGVFEFPSFAHGTKEIARAMSEADAVSIVGGGDSVAAITQLGFADKVSHISTGGGACVSFLEGAKLPGIECLQNKSN